jgi:ABC-2 type transport system ATP-binding protein
MTGAPASRPGKADGSVAVPAPATPAGYDRATMPSDAPPQSGWPDRPSPPVTISVENLSKSFPVGAEPSRTIKDRLLAGRRHRGQTMQALREVDFRVRQGECLGVLGHNGSGKSTLLKIMAGTLQPTVGRIRVRGRLAALLELGAGFHPDLTGRENIHLNASILGFDRDHVDAIFDDIVDFAELEDFVDLQVKYYSSGMTARLGFAVATHLEPDILLVDEVLAVGDEAFQDKCMARVHRFRSLGRTLVIVSHSPASLRELCDRAVVLERGRLLHDGDVDQAVEVYRSAVHDPSRRSVGAHIGDHDAGTGRVLHPHEQGQARPVELLSAHVVDGGTEVPFEPGDRIRVVVRYRLIEPVEFRIRLALRAQDNVVMINRSTDDVLDRPLPDRPGVVEILFTLDDLPLLDGVYRFTVVAETPDAEQVFDRLIPDEAQFAVQGPDPSFGRVPAAIRGQIRPLDITLDGPSTEPLVPTPAKG